MQKRNSIVFLKVLGVLLVLAATVFIGFAYVAPRIILKINRQVSGSTAADFGMRYDEQLVVSEDSLDLKGDFIYPFQSSFGDQPTNHSLIILHPIGTNTRSTYSTTKSMIAFGINFISFDSRGHGRSDGHMYTLGLKEVKDIQAIMDAFVENYPDHSFGIYAKGNSGNIALKAMEQDDRIRYGIIEQYYDYSADHIKALNFDDIVFNNDIINEQLVNNTLKFLKTTEEEVDVNPAHIHQPLLLLGSEYTYDNLCELYENIASEEKEIFFVPYGKFDRWGYPRMINPFSKLTVRDFILMNAEKSKQYIKEQVFQPS